MLTKRSLLASGLSVVAASSLAGLARAQGKFTVVFVGHEL
jgi:hypothetical protein